MSLHFPFSLSMDVLADILFFTIFVIVPWMRRRKQQSGEAEQADGEETVSGPSVPKPLTPAERFREVLSGGGGLAGVGGLLRESLEDRVREHAPEAVLPEARLDAGHAARIRAAWERVEARMETLPLFEGDPVHAECVSRLQTHLERIRSTLMDGLREGSAGSQAALYAMSRAELDRLDAFERVMRGRTRSRTRKQMMRGDRLYGDWFAPLTLSEAPWSPWIFLGVPTDTPVGLRDLLAEIDVMAVPVPEDPDQPDAWVLQVRDIVGELVLRSSRGGGAVHQLARQLCPGNVDVLPPGVGGAIRLSDIDNLVQAWVPTLLLDQLAGWILGPALAEAWVHGGMPGAEADRIEISSWGGRIHSVPPEHVRVRALIHGFSLRGREAWARHAQGTWMEHHGDPDALRLILESDRSAAIPVDFFWERVEVLVRRVQQVPLVFLGGRILEEEGAWECVGPGGEDAVHWKPARSEAGTSSGALAFAEGLSLWRRRESSTPAFWRRLEGAEEVSSAPEEQDRQSGILAATPRSSTQGDWAAGWVLNAILGPPPALRRSAPGRRSRPFARVP